MKSAEVAGVVVRTNLRVVRRLPKKSGSCGVHEVPSDSDRQNSGDVNVIEHL